MILRPYKRIRELEQEINKLKNICADYWELRRKEEEREEKENKGWHWHNATALCIGCKNLVTQTYGYPYGCKLDCQCEDREE